MSDVTSRAVLPRLPDDAVVATVGRFVTRYPDSSWLDLLALRASGGRFTADDLVALARAGDLDGMDGRDLARFAYVLASEPGERATLDDVAALFDHAMASDPRVGARVKGLWLQALLLTGRLATGAPGPDEEEVPPDEWWAVSSDLVNPFGEDGVRPDAGSDEVARWLATLNRPFTGAKLEPVRLSDGDGSPFDRLAAKPVDRVDGDLVSVVIPIHNPDASLLTSVQSVLAQSWANIEVLLSDDASTTGHELLERCAALDPRVRLLRAPRNRGTYAARNLGLAHASGQYVTFQDSDDYSHPRRIEREVAALRGDERAVAAVAHAIRATDTLHVAVLGLRKIAFNLSSLLVERERVVGALGGFDTVRRSGDREFLGRITATFGEAALVTLPEPLAVIQLAPGSLSRGDMGFLRRHAARQSYAVVSSAWHREIAAGDASPYLEPGTRAPIPAPSYIETGAAAGDSGSADVALLADPAASAPTDIGPMVDTLVGAGRRVAVVEFPGPRDSTHPPDVPGDLLGARLLSGAAHWLLPEEHVEVHLAVVNDPAAVLTMPSDRLAAVRAEHLVLAADRVGDYDPAAVAERAAAASHGQVHWLPANEAVSLSLRSMVPEASLLPAAPWLVLPGASREPRPLQVAPVVGLVPPHDVELAKRTEWEHTLVPKDTGTDVWCFGRGRRRLGGRAVTRAAPPEIGWPDFLDRVDYLVLPPMSAVGLARGAVDAWAHGTVVIADDRLRPHLGDAAVYLEGGSVDACIERLRQDPALHAAVQQRALGWVRRLVTPEGLLRTYREVLRAVERT
jgi:hypothetical protein